MNSAQIELFTYKIPFVEPFKSAAGTFENREGLLIRLQKNGITALGEASPLPTFSDESLPQVIDELSDGIRDINNHFASSFTIQSTLQFLQRYEPLPSLQFGLLTLAATFLSQQKSTPLQQLFSSKSRESADINAVIGINSVHKIKNIKCIVNQGYQTVKLKAGSDFSKFLSLIEAIRSQFSQLSLRIDANQSWTIDQAAPYLSELAPFRIEYCEEPLADPTEQSIQTLAETSPVPIALDESIFQTFSLSRAAKLASTLIVKPTVWGGRFLSDYLQNRQDQPKLVFTTGLESGVGRLMTAAFAASFGNKILAHGLDTGSMLTNDIWRDNQFIENGCFHLPDVNHLKKLMVSDLPRSIFQKIFV
jgi:o-succinylbenzoate synthase